MKSKSILFLAFILIIIAQLFVPIQMINSQEDTLSTGKIFKFKTAPVDPYDAFRGKFIYLDFQNDKIPVNNELNKCQTNDDVFVTFRDSAGYALPLAVSISEPETSEYLKAKVSYVDNNVLSKFNHGAKSRNTRFLYIDYHFNRFYMNEYKAADAENVYRETNRDLNKNVYAEVAIKNGVGVVKNVFVNGIPIKDYVEKPN